MTAVLVQEGNRQAGVRRHQSSSGLFAVNKQQPGLSYIEKGLFGDTMKNGPGVKTRGRDRWAVVMGAGSGEQA